MKRMLFNVAYSEELRVAIIDEKKLLNFDVELLLKEQKKGNIYRGVITKVELSLEACFVDYGCDRQGFLPFKEIDVNILKKAYKNTAGTQEDTGDNFWFNKLKSQPKALHGQSIIIQVEKDERGNKGAAVTTMISIPGRYLVLMPNNPKVGGISRKISGEDRDELRQIISALNIPQDAGIIIRTAAIGRSQEELQWDVNYLLKLWQSIESIAYDNTASVQSNLIYQESSLIIRSIRDYFSPDIEEILVDDELVYKEAKAFMMQIMPEYVDLIKLYTIGIPLFSRFFVEQQIESMYSRVVELSSGGSIVIDRTEALTAIDVNSAKSNKASDIEQNALNTNLEAAEEATRQIRMRDIGGLIVIDFIDMDDNRNQKELEQFIKQQFALDRARVQFTKLSKFGLMEISRQRLQASLEEYTSLSCPRCMGSGNIRATESYALYLMRIIQENLAKSNHSIYSLQIQLPVDIATFLLNEKKHEIDKMEARYNIKVILIPNLHLESPSYRIKKTAKDSPESAIKSYKAIDDIPDNNYQFLKNSEERQKQNNKNQLTQHLIQKYQNMPVKIYRDGSVMQLVGGLFDRIVKWSKKIFSLKQDHIDNFANNNFAHTSNNQQKDIINHNDNNKQKPNNKSLTKNNHHHVNSNSGSSSNQKNFTKNSQGVDSFKINNNMNAVNPSQNALNSVNNNESSTIINNSTTMPPNNQSAFPNTKKKFRDNPRNNTSSNYNSGMSNGSDKSFQASSQNNKYIDDKPLGSNKLNELNVAISANDISVQTNGNNTHNLHKEINNKNYNIRNINHDQYNSFALQSNNNDKVNSNLNVATLINVLPNNSDKNTNTLAIDPVVFSFNHPIIATEDHQVTNDHNMSHSNQSQTHIIQNSAIIANIADKHTEEKDDNNISSTYLYNIMHAENEYNQINTDVKKLDDFIVRSNQFLAEEQKRHEQLEAYDKWIKRSVDQNALNFNEDNNYINIDNGKK